MAADGSIIFEANLDDRQAQTKLNQLKSKIQRLQSSLEKSTGEQSGIKEKLDSAKASAQQTEKEIKQIMAALQSELALNEDVQSGKISMSAEELQQAAERQDDLLLKLKEQQDILKRQDQEIQSLGRQYDRVTEKISRQTQELNDAKNEASDYARQVIESGKSQNVMAEVTQKTSAIMAQLGERIKAIAKRALIFSVIASAIKALKDILGKAIAQNKEAAAAVSQLKAALLTLAQPIIETVLPAFTAFVKVLSKVVTAVAKFVSLLFGKSFSQTKKNAQSLNSQAGAIENVGGAAKEASKYLADFDELNVMDNQSDDQTGGGFDSPDFSKLDADVSIFDNLLTRLQKIWQDIKNIFLDLKDIVVDFFSGDWGDMLEKINLLFWHIQDLVSDVLMFVSEAFGDIIDWIVEKLHLSGTPIGQALEGIKEIVQGAIELIVNFLNLNLDGVLASIEKMLKGVQDLVFGIGDFLQNGINNLFDWFDEKTGGALHDLIEIVRATVNNIFEFVDDIVGSILLGVKDMLNGIITFLNGVFSGNWKQAWEGLMQFVKGIGTTIAGIFASVINVIIRALNWMISQINRISIKIPDWVPGIGGRTYGPNIPTIAEIPVPHLAEGAVIPPNREFMAVLGDQKHGTNIEAPADLIRQIVREELGSGGEEITIKFTGDLAALARVLSPEITRQQRRNQRALGV